VPTIQGVGTVEAKVMVNVSSKITDRVVSVRVDRGDQGEAAPRVSMTRSTWAGVNRAEASMRAAEAQLRDLLTVRVRMSPR
jgi:hypothetical protein